MVSKATRTSFDIYICQKEKNNYLKKTVLFSLPVDQ